MLVKVPVQFVQKQMKTSLYLDLFVWMFCRIDEKFFYWSLNTKVREFPSFHGINWSKKNAKGQTYRRWNAVYRKNFQCMGPDLSAS